MDPNHKQIVKEAIKEWLDERMSDFGWWSFKVIATTALAGLLYAYISARGFKFP